MSESTETQDFRRWIKSLTFIQFARVFGVLWGEEAKRYIKWDWWPGVRGWDGQREMLEAMATAEILWMAKGRQLAASEGAGLYVIYVSITEPEALSMWFSKDSPSAAAALKERIARKIKGFVEFCRQPDGKPWPWFGSDGKPVFWKYGRDNDFNEKYIEFTNGSIIESHSSDDSGSASRSPRATVFDEARYYEMKQASEIWASFIGGLRPPRQLFCISTNQPGTWYSQMTKKVFDGQMSSARTIFMPADIELTPTGEKRWDDAGLYRKKKLEQYGGDETRLKVMHPMVPADMFASHEGKVIGNLDEKKHRVAQPWFWGIGDENHLIYDHGNTEGHPSVATFIRWNRYTNKTHVYGHVFTRAQPLPVTGPKIREAVESYRRRGAPEPICTADGSIFNDYGVKSVGSELEEITGLKFFKALKHDKEGSVEALIKMFFNYDITIDPICVDGWKQLDEWMWDPKYDEPSEIEDDFPDTLRYFVARIRKQGPPRPPPSPREQSIARLVKEMPTVDATAVKVPDVGMDFALDDSAMNSWMGV